MNTRIPFGKVGKPHGIRGEVHFWPFNPDSDAVCRGLLLHAGDRVLRVTSVRAQGRSFLLRLDGVETREDAALLTNLECEVERSALPDPAEDEWYKVDLEGLPVYSRESGGLELLGHVRGFVDTPGEYDVMVVEGERLPSRLLVLWRQEIVESVDLGQGVILAALDQWAPEGFELRP